MVVQASLLPFRRAGRSSRRAGREPAPSDASRDSPTDPRLRWSRSIRGRRPGRRALAMVSCLVLGAATFVAMEGSVGLGATAAEVIDQHLAVPSYFWPGDDWQRLIGSGSAVGLVIVNPNSGPGSAPISQYQAVSRAARATGQQVLGYVDTSYGTRLIDDVLADVDRHYAWYGVDGIFLDQVTDNCSALEYYRSISQAIKAKGGLGVVAINPGMNTNECFAAVAEVIVNFEGTEAMYQNWEPADWVWNHPASQFWQIIYGVPAADQSSVVRLTKERHAGNVMVTSDVLPNPFDVLPPDDEWQPLIRGVRNLDQPTTTSTTILVTTTAPPTTVAPTTVPPTTLPPTTLPPTTLPPTTLPPTTVPPPTLPPTTVPPTTVPPTTVPPPTVPPTTAAPPTVPPTTVPPTTVPSTSAPRTTIPVPTTTVAPLWWQWFFGTPVGPSPTVTVPPSTVPSSPVPPTTVAATTVPRTTLPATTTTTRPVTSTSTTTPRSPIGFGGPWWNWFGF